MSIHHPVDREWVRTLPSPYDMEFKDWTVLHAELFNKADQAKFAGYQFCDALWTRIHESGKDEFLERNGITREDTRVACVEHFNYNYVKLAIMCKMPEEIKTLFFLTFNDHTL